MGAISDLPMVHDIDADYSPQYVKLARIIRDKIESGQYGPGDPVPAAVLAREHKISMRVAWAALAMLAANRYLARPTPFKPYYVTWDAAQAHARVQGAGGSQGSFPLARDRREQKVAWPHDRG
jgi:DNA-binding FadR family transcriptional regulator